MLQTVRDYAAEKLEDAGERSQTHQRHLAYFCEWVESAAPRLEGPDIVKWMQRLKQEQPNVVAALRWASESAEQIDQERGLRIGAALGMFWQITAWPLEGPRCLDDLLCRANAERHGVHYARALVNLGRFAVYVGGDVEWLKGNPSVTAFRQSLELFKQVGDFEGIADASFWYSFHALGRGYSAQRQSLMEQAVELGHECGRPDLAARAKQYLGDVYFGQEDYGNARRVFTEALDHFERVGDNFRALDLLASSLCRLNLIVPMPDIMQKIQALAPLAHQLESPFLWRRTSNAMALLSISRGDYAQAWELFTKLLAHAVSGGDVLGEMGTNFYLAETALHLQNFPVAELHAKRMIQLAETYPSGSVWCGMFYLAQARHAQGGYADAEEWVRAAIVRADELAIPAAHSTRGPMNVLLGLSILRQRPADDIYPRLREAIRILGKADTAGIAPVEVAMAARAIAHGQDETAATQLGTVAKHATGHGSLFPAARWELEDRSRELRERMGEPSFQRAWAAGQEMTLAEAQSRTQALLG
jgi:tetratricopeptide (TPR) repeat protein